MWMHSDGFLVHKCYSELSPSPPDGSAVLCSCTDKSKLRNLASPFTFQKTYPDRIVKYGTNAKNEKAVTILAAWSRDMRIYVKTNDTRIIQI